MKSLRRFLARTFSYTKRHADDDRLREEIEEHIALQTEENLRAGLSPVEARRQAILKFGAMEAIKEDYRATRGFLPLQNWIQDVRVAFRLLRKTPGFTAIAALTLAMAIGANAVVFGVMNGLILKPLNVPQSESLYAIERLSDHNAVESYPNYIDFRDRNRSFNGLAAFSVSQAALDVGHGPSLIWNIEASGNYFDILGIQPYVGRFFHAADEHGPNSAPYIVLSYGYWHSHFQDDRAVVGREVQINKHPFTIIGVAPPEFYGTLLFVHPDFFVPMVNEEQVEGVNNLNERGTRWVFMALGHLKPGVTTAQAIADLDSIGAQLEKDYPRSNARMKYTLARPGLFGDYIGRPVQQFLAGLMLLAGLILLAACANLGSLYAARAADRSREIALRLALGSSRIRILRGLFTEAVMISLMGGAIGVWGSVLILRWLSTWRPISGFPGYVPVNADAHVYLVALLLALASGLLFGAVPVKQVLRTDPYQVVKLGSTGAPGRKMTARDILLAGQIAICAVLVTSSMVAVRGLVHSLHSHFGFDPQHAMVGGTDLTIAGYSGDKVPAMQRRMIDAMEAIPGVKAVGLIDALPLDTQNIVPVFADQTTDMASANAAAPEVDQCNVSPDYFRAAGTVLLAGRSFTWHDDKNSPRVAVINQEFARKVFGSVSRAEGGYYKLRDGTRIQVVGVAEDGKYNTLSEDPLPAMFLPLLQSPASQTNVVVRSDQDPSQMAQAMKHAMENLDAGLLFSFIPWTANLEAALLPSRVATVALGVLGVMAAMLAVTGIFGMAAYSVSKRRKELGIRLALGAQRKEVLQAALGRSFKLMLYGSVAGLLLGILASRVLAFVVYQATSRDPLVLGGAVLAMALLGLTATWIPAQRALQVDPVMLMREE